MALDTALIACVRLIMGNQDYDAIWQDRRTGWRDAAHVRIQPISVTGLGVDELRYTTENPDPIGDVPPGYTARERVFGQRVIRVQITCETDDQDSGADAVEVAETLAAGFHRTDVLALLDAEYLGGVRVQPRRVISYPGTHGDQLSAVVFEVWLNASRSQAGGLIPMVKAVEVTGSSQTEEATLSGPLLVDAEG